MTTKTRILSSLMLTAATLVIVPLGSDAASDRGLGGSSGARSSSAVRTSPASAHKLSTTSASQRKLTATPAGAKEKYKQTALQARKLREVETGKEHGGKIEKEHPDKKKHRHLHLIYPVGIGAIPAAVDPPGCVYERRVQKLPGGGLQRVVVKVCPGA